MSDEPELSEDMQAEDMPTEELEAFFAGLGATHPGPGNYRPLDRYRDFRQVFLGSDQGRRVLHEILSMGRMISSSLPAMGPIDANRVLANEARRTLAIDIFASIHREPVADRPMRSNKFPGNQPEGQS